MRRSRGRTWMRWRIVAGTLTALLLAAAGSRAAEYVVRPGQSIGEKAAGLRPGDTLLIKAGTYRESVLISGLVGTQDAPITIRGEKGAVLDATGTDGFTIDGNPGAAWLVIEGLEIRGARRAGILLQRSHHITLRNLVCVGNRKWQIHTRKSDYITVENCDLSGATLQHGVYFSSTDHPVARGNRIHHNSTCGIHMNGEKREGGDGLISNGIIEGNLIYNNGFRGGGSAINMAAVEKTIIRNNLVYNNGAGGIVSYAGDIGHGGSGNLIYNNIVYFEPGRGRFGLQLVHRTKKTTVMNNIFVGGLGPALAVDKDSLDGLKSDYNIFYQHGTEQPIEVPRDNRISFDVWRRLTSQDAHSLLVQPRFVNPAAGDLHLRPGSKGIDDGTVVPVGKDIDGKTRPAGRAFDIGAYEH